MYPLHLIVPKILVWTLQIKKNSNIYYMSPFPKLWATFKIISLLFYSISSSPYETGCNVSWLNYLFDLICISNQMMLDFIKTLIVYIVTFHSCHVTY